MILLGAAPREAGHRRSMKNIIPLKCCSREAEIALTFLKRSYVVTKRKGLVTFFRDNQCGGSVSSLPDRSSRHAYPGNGVSWTDVLHPILLAYALV